MEEIKLLTIDLPKDSITFYELILSLTDYFTDYQTLTPSIEDVIDEFWDDIPINTNLNQKKLLSIYEGQNLIGFVDLLFHYPTPNAVTLGYLVLHKNYRGIGLGKIVYSMIEELISSFNNIEEIRLGVLNDNLPAFFFWNSLGFVSFETIDSEYGTQTNMYKKLDLDIHSV